MGAIKQEQLELSKKLKSADQTRSNAEAGLKIAERQTKEQRQKLYSTEIELAMKKQMVIDLQVELKGAKEEFQLAKEVVEVENMLLCILCSFSFCIFDVVVISIKSKNRLSLIIG